MNGYYNVTTIKHNGAWQGMPHRCYIEFDESGNYTMRAKMGGRVLGCGISPKEHHGYRATNNGWITTSYEGGDPNNKTITIYEKEN